MQWQISENSDFSGTEVRSIEALDVSDGVFNVIEAVKTIGGDAFDKMEAVGTTSGRVFNKVEAAAETKHNMGAGAETKHTMEAVDTSSGVFNAMEALARAAPEEGSPILALTEAGEKAKVGAAPEAGIPT